MSTVADAPARAVWDQLDEAMSPAVYRPRLRDGLLWRELTSARGEEYVIVQNPDAATYLRLAPDEFFLFERMDGSRTIQQLVVEYMLEFHRFAMPRVVQLVQQLKVNQFLIDPPRFVWGPLRARLDAGRVGRFVDSYAKSLIQREFPVDGLDGILTRVYRAGASVLYKKPVLIALVLIAVMGVPAFVWTQLTEGPPLTVDGSLAVAVPLYYAFFIVVAVTHELAHAFTVKAYGRTVRRGGISIYYGAPGLFVDTQDIWMEPRRARIAASWAGPFSGFVLAGLAGLGLVLLPDGPWTAILAIFGTVALVSNVFQLMPLIELDGYFVLMDWLEIPNLRKRALAFVRRDCWAKLRRRQKFNREERIFAVFGLLAGIYTVYVLVAGLGFGWVRAESAIRDAFRVPNLGSLVVATLVLLLMIPLALALVRRLRQLALSSAACARRMRRLGEERWYRERVVLLGQVPALAELGKAEVQWLARRMRSRSVTAGTTVVRQGDSLDRFYVVVTGEAEVLRDEPEGSRVVTTLGPLDYFGERALLDDAASPSALRAKTPMQLMCLSAEDFRSRLAPHFARQAMLQSRLASQEELDRFPLLEPLAAAEKDLLLSRLREMAFAPDEVVVEQGTSATALCLIRKGRIAIFHRDEGCVEEVLQELGPGDFFGETALLLDVDHPSGARALERTELWVLGSQDFHDVVARYLGLRDTFETTAHTRLSAQQTQLGPSASSKWLDVDVGDPAPDFSLEAVQGGVVALSSYRGQTVVLWFSRGYNCPFCRKYMAQLAPSVPRFREAGVQILQVAPNLIDRARLFWGEQELPFPFLCDPDKASYRLCGLCDLGAGEANRNTVKGFAYAFANGEGRTTVRGVWLDVMNRSFGERVQHHALTAMQQGVFVIDGEGVIRHKFVFGPLDPVPSNEELLSVATSVTA